MNLPQQLAKHLRDVHFGGNWTWVNVKDSLANLTWEQATTKVDHLNTIVALVYHMNYYVAALIKVSQGGPLDAHDKYSFSHPEISSQQDWEKLVDKVWADAETLAGLVEQMPESRIWEPFDDGKYGTYYRNIQGVIEHTHYHLGQVVIIKKMLSHNDQG